MTHQNKNKISKVIFFSFLFIFLFLISSANAADRFWVASGSGDKIWWDNNNWSNQDGGSPGYNPPSNGDNAFFTSSSVLDAKITTNVKVRKIILRNGYTGTVRIESGTFNATKGVNHQDGTILVSGTGFFKVAGKEYTLASGATLTFEGSNSKFKVDHNFKMYDGSTFTAPSAGSSRFILKGGFNVFGGTFNHNNGTLFMSPRWSGSFGAAINIVGGPGPGKNLYNLTKNVSKHLTLTTNIEIENDLKIIGTGSLKANGKNITIGGDWDLLNASNFVRGSGTVTFNGSSTQTIDSPAQFNNLTITNTAGAVSLVGSSANASIASTLTINNGANFDINGKNLTANTLVNNGNLQLLGSETVNITTMDTDSGTVTYDGSGATGLAAGDNYFDLTFNQSGISTLDANLDVNGDLTITSGTLDASTSNHDIAVGGDWTNNGSFISRSGTVTFDNNSNVFSGGTGASNDFNDVVLSGTAGSQSDNIQVNGDFTISSTGTWSTNCNTLTVDGNQDAGIGTIANSLTPDVDSFVPANGNSTHAAGDNITINFNTGLRKASDNSDLTNSNIDAHITLKDTNSTGADISFDATIDASDQVVTINPDANLNSSQVVYVAVTNNTLENACNTALPAHSATFTVADTEGPTLSSSNPSDGATTMGVNSNIVLTFNEVVNVASGNITIHTGSTEVESIDVTGSKVTGSGSTEITINPDTTLDEKTDYYINIESGSFEDSSGNIYAGITNDTDLNFTTVDTTAPVVTITPSNGQTGIGMNTNITIEFDEAIRKTDDSEITDASVDDHIILKETDSSGANISFDATINTAKTIITIDPTSDFSSSQTIYAAIKAEVEDSSDNAISLTESTFTTATPTNPPTVSISAEAGVPADTNITIEFDKSVRLLSDVELTDTNVVSLITLKDTDVNGNNISFVATVNSAKTKITINPVGDFTSGQTIYAAIGATVEDFFDNAISAASETFTVADNLPPTYVFNPPDTEINVAVNSNLTITFNEAVRNINDTALTDSNVDSLITLKDTDDKWIEYCIQRNN